MRFKDQIAIVTGGASGIGKEVAARFVAGIHHGLGVRNLGRHGFFAEDGFTLPQT